MTSAIKLNPSTFEDFFKSSYEEVDAYPFMRSPVFTVTMIVLYFLFVKFIGPRFMKNREPYKLRTTLVAYNAFQVALSAYMFYRYTKFVLDDGLVKTKCYLNQEGQRNEIFINIYIYYIAKVTELFDTVLFVLRKKYSQVTFLHVYHHSLMMFCTWCYLKYSPYENVIFMGALNSFIHVFMYTYYGLAAIGPHMAKYLTWKKYMTVMQLIQFVLCFVIYNLSLVYSDCPPSKTVATFIVFNNLLMLVLFLNFYIKNYTKTSKSKGAEIENDFQKNVKAKLM